MSFLRLSSFLAALFGLVLPCAVRADSKPALRIIRDQCIGCHKPGKAKGGLLLTTYEKMMKGGDNGVPIVPGKAADSLIYKSVLPDGDPHMPPKKQLADAEVAALKTWINEGGKWDDSVFNEPPAPKAVKLATVPAAYHPVLSLALSPDDKRLAVARGHAVLIIDLAKADYPVLGRLEGHTEPVQSVVWTPDGKSIISGGWQRIMIWDVATMKQSRALSAPFVGNITALAVDPKGAVLFAADGESGGAGFVRRFDLASGTLVATWKAHEDTVYSLRLSAKGDRLLSGGADKLAKIWDTTTNKLIAFYEGHTNHVLSVAFNNDATQIATAGADKEVKVWDVKSREQDVSLGDKKTVFTGLAWSPDGKALAAVTDKGTGSVYSALQKHDGTQRSDTGKERKLSSVDDSLTSVAITADAKLVFGGSFSGKVHVWDASSGKEKTPIEGK